MSATNQTFVDFTTPVPAAWLNNVNAFVNDLYVPNIASLRMASYKGLINQVYVQGYYTPRDNGGGLYILDPLDSSSLDNGGTIIVGADGGRWKLQQTHAVWLEQFGATGNGSTDDTTAIQACINTVGGLATIYARGGANYVISSTIQIGNGSLSAPSTRNGVVIQGLSTGTTTGEVASAGAPVLLTWAGVAGGTMVSINGPIYGLKLQGLQLNCASIANTGLVFSHPMNSRFEEITVQNYKGAAYVHTAYSSPTACVTGSQHNTFISVHAKSPAAGGNGIVIGNSTNGSSPFLDVAQNTYIGCNWWFDATSNTTYGVALQFADNNTFIECTTYPQGGSLGIGLFINPPTGNTAFPLETTFYNCAIQGGVNDPGTWTTTLGIGFFPYPTGDGQPVPVSPILGQYYGYTTSGQLIGGLDISTTSTRISAHLSVTQSLTFGTIAAQASSLQFVSIPGAVVGDTVDITNNSGTLPSGGILQAIVNAGGSVEVSWTNASSVSITPGTSTYRIDVWRH